jgi:hypothetical protein
LYQGDYELSANPLTPIQTQLNYNNL